MSEPVGFVGADEELEDAGAAAEDMCLDTEANLDIADDVDGDPGILMIRPARKRNMEGSLTVTSALRHAGHRSKAFAPFCRTHRTAYRSAIKLLRNSFPASIQLQYCESR